MFLTHNTVQIGDQEYIIKNDDWIYINIFDEQLDVIRLTKDQPSIKLVKYQVSYSLQKAIFFFLKRDDKKKSKRFYTQEKLAGVYFFCVKTFDEI